MERPGRACALLTEYAIASDSLVSYLAQKFDYNAREFLVNDFQGVTPN
jgi:hypothetical protein